MEFDGVWIPPGLRQSQVTILDDLVSALGADTRPYMNGAFLLKFPADIVPTMLAIQLESIHAVFTSVQLHYATDQGIVYRVYP